MKWFKRDPDKCRITQEHDGCFIGRRHCHTHDLKWERGGPICPTKREPKGRDIRVGVDIADGQAAVVVVEVKGDTAYVLHSGLYSEEKP